MESSLKKWVARIVFVRANIRCNPVSYEAIVASQSHQGESVQRIESLATMQKAIETEAKAV